ncbi:MAG TPA: peptidyl-prolyl cis-trans isomerase [Gemmatimonadaceae bacterium]|nr:peptidyl-prolyl cis-trans isomerase [Gemmatimonadaceae bacterium]
MDWMRRFAPVVFLVIAVTFIGGFLLVESSGLLGRGALTPTTAVATVNGQDILATRWFALTQQLEQAEMQEGRTLTLDDRERIADRAFEEMVTNVLLQQEYRRRGIRVTDDEIRTAAMFSPPSDLMQSPELQTDGRFDPAKYQRLLASPAARQQGLLAQLEEFYRTELPRQKLLEQVAGNVYSSDHQLWLSWQARNDSARASFVRYAPEEIPDAQVSVSDGEIRAYYEGHKENFERPGRALVSVMVIPRTVTAADSVATRDRAAELRQEILSGARTFEDAAQVESADSASAQDGGNLGAGPRGRFVPPFEEAAYALSVGGISQPVLTQFGYHLIRVDERRGDTLSARHILLPIQQTDSAAVATDRRADSLSRMAGAADDPRRFDEASRALGLPIQRGMVIEGEPFVLGGRYVPGVAAWSLGGARRGEVSELLDWEDGYALARLDSITRGGTPPLADVAPQIRTLLMREKKLDALMTVADPVARQAATSTLEQAAAAHSREVQTSDWFTRVSPAGELGRVNEAIGASFTLPVGRVSAPIRTLDGVFVLRVAERREADRAEFEAQKAELREEEKERLQQERIQLFMQNLRETAKVVDRRLDIAEAQRQIVVP